MDLNRIAVFARVVDEGSFTKAALALGLPKSSVSRAVALLEDELGTRLLQRSSRKLSATEAGMAYYAQVAGALSAIDQANACAAERREVPQGLVRVTAPFDAGRDVFIPIFTRFIEKHPAITIDLMLTARHVDLVEEGVDLGIRAGKIRDQSLIARKISDVRHGLFASRAYVSRHGAPETVAEFAGRACIVHHGTRGRATWTLHAAERVEAVDVTGPLAVDDMRAARDAMLEGAGIALLPPLTCARELRTGDVVRLLPAWIGPPVPLSVVYPSARLMPQRVVLVRDHLLAELPKIPWACTEEPRWSRTRERRGAVKAPRG